MVYSTFLCHRHTAYHHLKKLYNFIWKQLVSTSSTLCGIACIQFMASPSAVEWNINIELKHNANVNAFIRITQHSFHNHRLMLPFPCVSHRRGTLAAARHSFPLNASAKDAGGEIIISFHSKKSNSFYRIIVTKPEMRGNKKSIFRLLE